MRSLLAISTAITLAWWFGQRVMADDEKESSGIAAGQYSGAGQPMMIADDGKITYDDALNITHLQVFADESIKVSFPDKELGRGGWHDVTLRLTTTEPRPTWTTKVGADTYKATAIPFSPKTYVFRLEILTAGKVVAGAREFYALEPRFHPIFPPE